MPKRHPFIIATCLTTLSFIQFSAPAHAEAEAEAVQPGQIAELYLGAFLNEDVSKAEKLNEILRPTFSGKDGIDTAQIPKMSATIVDQMTAVGLKEFPENKRADLKEPLTRMNKAILDAAKRSKCTATDTKLAPSEYVKTRRIATVSFECQVADLTSSITTLKQRQDVPLKDAPPTPSFLDAVAQAFDQAPLTLRFKGQMKLYSTGEKQTLWVTGSPGEPYSEVISTVIGQMKKIADD